MFRYNLCEAVAECWPTASAAERVDDLRCWQRPIRNPQLSVPSRENTLDRRAIRQCVSVLAVWINDNDIGR